MSRGSTIVACDGDLIVGTITLKDAQQTTGSSLYNRPEVAAFGQFAVRPAYQRLGIGSALLSLAEQLARENRVRVLALDTSEQATSLISMYQSKGYAFIEYVQWPDVNYRSVILAKDLR